MFRISHFDGVLRLGSCYLIVVFAGSLLVGGATAQTAMAPLVAAKKLAFLVQPANTSVGSVLSPTPKVSVENASGNLVPSNAVPVTITLVRIKGMGVLAGNLIQTSIQGQATFGNLSMSGGGTYQLIASSRGLASAISGTFDVLPVPTSAIAPPPANQCQSSYDQYYGSEPGVYAYWPLCEHGASPAIHDYVGPFDLVPSGGKWGATWGAGMLTGGRPGPVADGETAVQVATASDFIESMGVPLNSNQGTITAWVNANSQQYPTSALFLGAVNGLSSIAMTVNQDPHSSNGTLCLAGTYQNSAAISFTSSQCGYGPDSWHRVVLTWASGLLRLYVDGAAKASAPYSGSLDNKLFYYRLFPGCCDTGQQMTLAKLSVSNQAWTAAQVCADFVPALPVVPSGGVHVSSQTMGVIHRDVLGYADNNANLSGASLIAPLVRGLKAAGVTAVRYAGGSGGMTADLGNWQSGAFCTTTNGTTADPQNTATNNNLDSYLSQVAQPLGLHIGYTVNYGTNPPLCNSGGDPAINGANLVDYANNFKHYGIKYWEIGNEVFSYQSETDFHSSPHTGGSYVPNETAFYNAMKARDASILVGVPIGEAAYDWQTNFDLPVLAGAKYDGIVWHNYPVADPISDGNTLYQDRVASNLNRTRGTLLRLQTELLNAGKTPDSIWVTEWNGDANGGNEWSRQSMGAVMPVFTVIQLAEYMQAGVQYAAWWAQGMSNACYQYYYDWTAESSYNWWDCGGLPLVYTGKLPGETAVGFKSGDLSPSARAFQLLSRSGFVTEGEHTLRTQSDQQNAPWLMSYAATHGSSYAAILINRDRDNSHVVPVTIDGKRFGSAVSQWTYGKAQYDQSYFGNWSVEPVSRTLGAWSGTFQATLPPLSVSVFIF